MIAGPRTLGPPAPRLPTGSAMAVRAEATAAGSVRTAGLRIAAGAVGASGAGGTGGTLGRQRWEWHVSGTG